MARENGMSLTEMARHLLQQIGVQLLKSVGLDEDQMDGDLIAQAVAANDAFIAELEAIRDKAQGIIQ